MPTHVPQSQVSLLKNVLIITPLSLIGHAGTFLIYIILANWFGDPSEMDFIYYYWGIAGFLIQLLSSASAYSVLVPLLAEARAKGETEAQRCVQSIFFPAILQSYRGSAVSLLLFRGQYPNSFSQLLGSHPLPQLVSYAGSSASRLLHQSAGCSRRY